jgi:hypothetical protein
MSLSFLDQDEPSPEQFDTSKLEQDLGDQAGLQPLPLSRMLRQAGRPMNSQYRSKPDPAVQRLTIERNQRNQRAIESWNPIEAENKQRLNNTTPNPRSKPATPDNKTATKFFMDLGNTADFRKTRAFNNANKDDPMWRKSGPEFKRLYGQEVDAQRSTDPSLFLTSQERSAVKSMVFDYLDGRAGGKSQLSKQDLPGGLDFRFPKLGNDLLYEWNARRQKQLQDATLDVLEIRKQTIRGI